MVQADMAGFIDLEWLADALSRRSRRSRRSHVMRSFAVFAMDPEVADTQRLPIIVG
jgi:hypothetical protein